MLDLLPTIAAAAADAAAADAAAPETAPWARIVWLVIGFGGQGLFFGRFLVQWLASERAGRSYVPVSFWWFSIGGSLMVLLYAIYRKDPVIIVGQSTGIIIYVRNLVLIRRTRLAEQMAKAAPDSGQAGAGI